MSELARWPSATDYIDVVQHPALVFRHEQMKEARFDLDMYGIPDGCTGSNAVVFRAMLGPKTAALRCFISQAGLSRDRYLALARHVVDEAHGARWVVSATWWDEAVKVKGQHWPVVEMEWVDGRPLDIYVGSLCQTQPAALHLLAARWREMLRELATDEVAHGDLQHGNVLVDQTTAAMRLVDLDSAWVPGMTGLTPPGESGHQAFRHPNRPDSDQWGPYMDTFAGLVVLVSLLALAHQPALWSKYNNGDNLLFTADDFVAVDATPLWTDLGTIDDHEFADLLVLLKGCCEPQWQPSGTLEELIVEWQGRPRATVVSPPEGAEPPAQPAPWAPPVPAEPSTPHVQVPLEDGFDWVVKVGDASSPGRQVETEPAKPSTPAAAITEPVESPAPPTELPPPPIVRSATMNAPVENTVLTAPTDGHGDTSNPFRPPPMARGKGPASKPSRPKPSAPTSIATGYMGWAVFATLVTACLAFPVYTMARRARAAGRAGDVAGAIERSHRAKRVAVTIVVIMVIAGAVILGYVFSPRGSSG